jgi:serine/threonine protein kinase
MAQLLQPKQQIAGYEVDELVGKGGMGEVYRARQISMDRVVALKILAPRLAKQDPIFAKRFVDEARAAGRLNHPNIIAVHDVGKATLPGAPAGEPPLEYFSMEFVDGESVKDLIDRQGAVPLSIVAQVMQGMAEALVYAESQNMVHRDIKPDNIMLTHGGIPKLADLGLAMQVGGEEMVAEKDAQGRGKVMGTPLYMSPEQARALPVDARSDQYSLGATLFHMLTGKPPFKGDNSKVIMRAHVFEPVPDPRAEHADVPDNWRQLCMKLMAKNPEDRFANAIAMRTAVQSATHGHALAGISRRTRASGGTGAHPSSPDSVNTLPPWAKYLVYGFGITVVIMVVSAFFIPWGSKTDPVAEIKPVLPPDPAVVAQQLLDTVRKEISALPDNPQIALEKLTRMSEDKAIPAGPPRDLIEKEISLQRSILADRQRKEQEKQEVEQAQLRQAKSIELEQALASNDLGRVKSCLDFLTTEKEKLTPGMQERLEVVRRQFALKLVDLQQHYNDQLMESDSWSEIQALKKQIVASPLTKETIETLSRVADQRAEPYKPKATTTPVTAPDKKELSSEESDKLKVLAGKIDALRGGLHYAEISQLLQNESAQFVSPEIKELLLQVERGTDFARKAESAIRAYVKDAKPEITLVYNNQEMKVQLVLLDKQQVGFIIPGGNGTVIKQAREAIELPLHQLVDQATTGEIQISAAAKAIWSGCLMWMWRHQQTDAVFEPVKQSKVVQALKKIEIKGGVVTPPPDKKSDKAQEGTPVTYVYGDDKKPWILEDFRGENIMVTAQGLRWVTNKLMVDASDESPVPTVQLAKEILPPFSMQTQLTMQPGTGLLMVGVLSGQHRARIGLNNTQKQNSAAAVVTNLDGRGIKVEGQKAGDYAAGTMVRLDIQIDADYHVVMKVNDQPLATYDFPNKKGTIIPIIQAFQRSGSTTALINSMKISGQLPPAAK